MAEEFRLGDRIVVLLSESHEIISDDEAKSHKAIFVSFHPSREWAEVLLDEAHRGGTRTLHVPVSQIRPGNAG